MNKKTKFKIGDELELIKTDEVKAGYSTMSLRAKYAIVVEIREEEYKVKLVFNDGGIDTGYLWKFENVKLFKTKHKLLNYEQY